MTSGIRASLELSLEMSVPTPQQDEHLPDQIEAFAHQAGLTVQCRLFQVLNEKADQDLVLQHRHGNGGTAEGPWLQVSALLLQLGVLSGERRLLVLGDGAAGIRTWFESLGISLQAMIVCWWHLRKRCSEPMSSAGGSKDLRRAVAKELVGPLWEGKVTAAIEHLKGHGSG